MLRVRPVHYTSRMQEYKALLTALELAVTADYETWMEFDAGHGRLAVHAMPAGPDDGVTSLGFEARDLEEFRRRTEEAGTRAEPFSADHGGSVKVTSPEGTVFLVDRANEAAEPHDADPSLTVAAVWTTTELPAAAKVLADIGARRRPTARDGGQTGSSQVDRDLTDVGRADFMAKNGGIITVQQGTVAGIAIGFEYDGGLEVLRDRLASAGFQARLTEDAGGRVLLVTDPDGSRSAGSPGGAGGGTIRIRETPPQQA
ncbi:VOC family protein [Arthrobacter sp. VKM Ac-2550]|uniref:VOC family protein n=1 Tax=Crystallibacter permensis TaxID=1938888 RepID=UPI0022262936|nr:VOC family protein [Arthrobacter sp. VKM Ac-2550]MCW2133142.1 hypothetical protein [Arthrobacter sp. VKM Ac-2550]